MKRNIKTVWYKLNIIFCTWISLSCEKLMVRMKNASANKEADDAQKQGI